MAYLGIFTVLSGRQGGQSIFTASTLLTKNGGSRRAEIEDIENKILILVKPNINDAVLELKRYRSIEERF